MMEQLGDLSITPGRSVALTCQHCQVQWRGCMAVSQCPRCGADKGYTADDLDVCYCESCMGVDSDYEAAVADWGLRGQCR